MAGGIEQVLRVEVTLNPSASTRERIMNVWHIGNVGATDVVDAAEAFKDDLADFYHAIDGGMSLELSGAIPLVRVFDLSHPMPRQPIFEEAFGALTTGSDSAARELAVCLSYKGTYVSGVSPKRRRGRVYLGPWASGVVQASTGRVDPTLLSGIVIAGQALFDAHMASTEYSWVVYSPTTDTSGEGVPTAASVVVSAWVDNEVDVQRRRGKPQPGVKTLIT